MGNIENRPKDGAPRLDAALMKSESLCRRKSCSVCFILSLICIHLATLIIVLDQTIVEAESYGQHGKNIKIQLLSVLKWSTFSKIAPVIIMCHTY